VVVVPIIRGEAFSAAHGRRMSRSSTSAASRRYSLSHLFLYSPDLDADRIDIAQAPRELRSWWRRTGRHLTRPEERGYSPVLRKPNGFQTRIQIFRELGPHKLQQWAMRTSSSSGDAAARRCPSLRAGPVPSEAACVESGEIFYELDTDNLSGLADKSRGAAREIIHDRFNCFFHPLVGLSPIFCQCVAATQGLSIQKGSALFLRQCVPDGGVVTHPVQLATKRPPRLKAYVGQ
jgi:phage portal protein BeeE